MATKEQIRANGANARRSTGPRTPEGKAKSSQNALKHGLRAQITVLPDENIDDFDVLISELEDEFQPATAIEWTLLRQLADAEWRMRRVPLIEAGVLAKELHESRQHYEDNPDQLPEDPAEVEIFLIGAMAVSDAETGDVLAKLSRYEARLSHRYFKALAHLRNIQDRRTRSDTDNPVCASPGHSVCAGPGNPVSPSNSPTQPRTPQAPPPADRGANPQNKPNEPNSSPFYLTPDPQPLEPALQNGRTNPIPAPTPPLDGRRPASRNPSSTTAPAPPPPHQTRQTAAAPMPPGQTIRP